MNPEFAFNVFRRLPPILRFPLLSCYNLLHNLTTSAKVACVGPPHQIIDFHLRYISKHLGLKIHFIQRKEDYSQYEYFIVKGFLFKDILSKIPEDRRIFIEVGFFPQNRTVYYDLKGVHALSSVPDIELPVANEAQRAKLRKFREDYCSKNYIKVSGHSVVSKCETRYKKPFIFVPLQYEGDTAYEHVPFSSNQEIVDCIESIFPDQKIIFKNHPDSLNQVRVNEKNVFLESTNRDLQRLLMDCEYVISGNSNVLLEALMHGKKCAAFGKGIFSKQGVCLECFDDLSRVKDIANWDPDQEKIDNFLCFLLDLQKPLFVKDSTTVQVLKNIYV